MGIVEDMGAFRGRYHQYTGAIEELRQAEEHRDRLFKVDERSFYARTGDDIVGRSRCLVATTRHDLVGAETRLREPRRDYASNHGGNARCVHSMCMFPPIRIPGVLRWRCQIRLVFSL